MMEGWRISRCIHNRCYTRPAVHELALRTCTRRCWSVRLHLDWASVRMTSSVTVWALLDDGENGWFFSRMWGMLTVPDFGERDLKSSSERYKVYPKLGKRRGQASCDVVGLHWGFQPQEMDTLKRIIDMYGSGYGRGWCWKPTELFSSSSPNAQVAVTVCEWRNHLLSSALPEIQMRYKKLTGTYLSMFHLWCSLGLPGFVILNWVCVKSTHCYESCFIMLSANQDGLPCVEKSWVFWQYQSGCNSLIQ